MNKKINFLSKVLIVVGIVLLLIGGYLMLNTDNNSKDNGNGNEKEIPIVHTEREKEIINVLDNVFLNDASSLEDIKEIVGNNIEGIFIILGEDSYLNKSLDNSILSENDLSTYRTKQLDYSSKVEDKYLSNIKYKVHEDDMGNVKIDITSWYYSLYCSDVSAIALRLMEKSGIDPMIVETDYSKYSIYEYKARVVAMKILNNHLDDYNNRDEVIEMLFEYENGVPKVNQYFSLYNNLSGATSKYMVNTQEKVDEQTIRIDAYINEAISSGLINSNNLLEI